VVYLFDTMNKAKENIEFKLIESWPEGDIVELYKAGGWWKNSYDSSGIEPLIKGSFAFAVAVDKKSKKAIGMGRIISDGVSDAYFQDIVILPEYRNQGIGKKIVETLIERCLSAGILWIGLIAEPDQDDFYTPIGFKPMKKYIPMKYEKED